MFEGFSPETQEFMLGVFFNNERPWFLEHKGDYESFVLKPMRELAQSSADIMNARYENERFTCHVSRIYRDARRLFGRGPYKDNMWFIIQTGSHHDEVPAFWFEISPFNYSYGMGFWYAPVEVLENYRKAIDAAPERFKELIRTVKGDYSLDGQEYKRPKGRVGDELEKWYNRKSLSIRYTSDYGEALYSPSFTETLIEAYDSLMPLYRFLRDVFSLS